MLKNHSVHIIATYALLVLASPLIFTSDASAQAVNCPTGYVCTLFRQTQVPSCPVGYVCTPVNSPGTNAVNANPTFNNGYYYSGSGYANTQNPAYQNIGSNNSVNSACHPFSRDLSVGSTGQDVVALQNFLISGGYSLPNIASGRIAKGNFGANTAAALRQYQTANGINENGRLGPLTRARINSSCSSTAPQTSRPTTPISTLPRTCGGAEPASNAYVRKGVGMYTPGYGTTIWTFVTGTPTACQYSCTGGGIYNGGGCSAPATPSAIDQKPVGYLDNVSCSLIAGWAYDPDNTAASIGVHFYAGGQAGSGGTFIGNTVANVSRPDVNSVNGITGNHGFSFPIPASLRDGAAHTIYAYGINSSGSASQNNAALTNNGLTIAACR